MMERSMVKIQALAIVFQLLLQHVESTGEDGVSGLPTPCGRFLHSKAHFAISTEDEDINFGLTPSRCTPRPACNRTSRFRTITGWCNNVRWPDRANVFGPLIRELGTNAYDDGMGTPRSRSSIGGQLPSPRVVSNRIHSTVTKLSSHRGYTHIQMQFMQLSHTGIVATPRSLGANRDPLICSSCLKESSKLPDCLCIPVPVDDPHFKSECLPFTRSLNGNHDAHGVRTQINQNTPFLDGSEIYGSNDCDAGRLRTMKDGLLKSTTVLDILPQSDQEKNCKSLPQFPCFMAGHAMSNLHPGLQTLHTVFLREHNRIARRLSQLQPNWHDERLYQESRRIVIAQLQHITYAEALPRVLGDDVMRHFDLYPAANGSYYYGYDETCDASITQAFATAAFRYGHMTVQADWARLDTRWMPMASPLKLGDNFLYTDAVYDRAGGGVESLTRGLMTQPQAANDRFASDAVRNLLFSNRNETGSGHDLIAINIMRGRDHGLSDYNTYRAYVGLPRAKDFDDLSTEMDSATITALRSVYAHVNDVDLFTGIISEQPSNGAQIGPTGQRLIGQQFESLKKCDRYFYENGRESPEIRFTIAQLNEIRRSTMGRLICNNIHDMVNVPEQVFDINSPRVPCMPAINVDLFV